MPGMEEIRVSDLLLTFPVWADLSLAQGSVTEGTVVLWMWRGKGKPLPTPKASMAFDKVLFYSSHYARKDKRWILLHKSRCQLRSAGALTLIRAFSLGCMRSSWSCCLPPRWNFTLYFWDNDRLSLYKTYFKSKKTTLVFYFICYSYFLWLKTENYHSGLGSERKITWLSPCFLAQRLLIPAVETTFWRTGSFKTVAISRDEFIMRHEFMRDTSCQMKLASSSF